LCALLRLGDFVLQEILATIEELYDCVGDRFDYQRAVTNLGQATDDTGISLVEAVAGQPGFTSIASHNIPPDAIQAMSGGDWDAQSHSLLRNLAVIQERVPVLRRTFTPDEEYFASRLYQETSAPWGLHSEGACIIEKRGGGGLLYGFNRAPDREEVGPEILSRMAVLSTHMWRAMHLQNRLNRLEQAVIQTNDILDIIDFGLLLYQTPDKAGFVNQAAQRMFSDKDGLELRRGELILGERNAQRQFSALLEALKSSSLPLSARAGGLVRLPRQSGKKPYCLLVTPTRGIAKLGQEGVSMAVFIFDPEVKTTSAIGLFASSYDLTPTEAGLAYELAQGITLEEFAEKRGITRNTAKWHLQSIFEKRKPRGKPN
jgi:DNA-binding CsgD family transcriptional regulator